MAVDEPKPNADVGPPSPEVPAEDGSTPSSGASSTSAPLEINLANEPEFDQPEAFAQRVTGVDWGPASPLGPAVIDVPYNSDESRDATRQTITLWLLGLLCAIVALLFVAIFARGASSRFAGPGFFSEVKQVLDVIVGPVITLLASAVGFYFGSKQSEINSKK